MSKGKFFQKGINTSLTNAALRAEGGEYQVVRVPLSQIQVNLGQPRRYFDDAALEELAQSIRQQGVSQPILLRRLEGSENLEIVYGERRFRASQLAEQLDIPAMIRDLTPEAAMQVSLMENLQREDLNPFEVALFKLRFLALALGEREEDLLEELPRLHRLVNKNKADAEQDTILALERAFTTLGGSWRTFAVHGVRVLKLPEAIADALKIGRIEYTKALKIASCSPELHAELLTWAEGHTREELEEKIRTLSPAAPSAEPVAVFRKAVTPKAYKRLPVDRKARADELMAELMALFE